MDETLKHKMRGYLTRKTNNIFIGYDLNKETDSKGYEKIIKGIEEISGGECIEIQKSLWFISTFKSCKAVKSALAEYIDDNDSLIVIDAKNNTYEYSDPDNKKKKFLDDKWEENDNK